MNMRKLVRWFGIFGGAAALMTVPALGQTITTIEVGQTLTGTATSGVDLYRVGGPAGTELTFELTGPGKSGLIFYTPDGEEMLTATGIGKARLSVILPENDAFVLGVVRGGRSAYSLKLGGIEPDGHFASHAAASGYRRRMKDGTEVTYCWVDPGRKLRAIHSTGEIIDRTIGRAGKFYIEASKGDMHRKWEYVRSVEGNEVVRRYTYSDGTTEVTRVPLEIAPAPSGGSSTMKLGYVSYLCA